MKQTDDDQHPCASCETPLISCEASESGLTWCQDLLVEMERIMDSGNVSTYDSHVTTESKKSDACEEEDISDDVIRQNIMVALNEVFYTTENGSSNSGGGGGEGWIDWDDVEDENDDETNISYGDEVLDLEEEEEEESDYGELDYEGLMVGIGKGGQQ